MNSNTNMFTLDNFRTLSETSDLLLGNIYEDVFLINKKDKSHIFMDDFYGDPECGHIDVLHNICLIGGEKLIIYDIEAKLKHQIEAIHDVFDLRNSTESEYEILTDPWSDESAIWKLNIITKELTKLSEFAKYRDLPYTDVVEW